MNDLFEDPPTEIRRWWARHRLRYTIGLAIAGIVAFVAYVLVGSRLVPDFEVTLFTIFFQGIGYLIMMGIANLFYYLGPFVDQRFNTHKSNSFRSRLFWAGCLFSYALPFSIPLLIILIYH